MREFHYKVPWLHRGGHPGFHRSSRVGAGYDFLRMASFLALPDPRRIDLRASSRDPFGQLQVRLYRQHSAIDVYQLTDVSASMDFGRKAGVAADFTAALGYSVSRTGDRFRFVGFDDRLRDDLAPHAALARSTIQELSRRLRDLDSWGSGAGGLRAAAAVVGPRRSLVFLVSDFHFDLSLIEETLSILGQHTVVPVVIWDSTEFGELPRSGLVRMSDSESGAERRLWFTPALRRRIRATYRRRRERLREIADRSSTMPLFLIDRFSADDVTAYFYRAS